MYFKKRWTNSGILDFSNDATVFDITAKNTIKGPVSDAVLFPIDRWNQQGKLNLSDEWKDNGQLEFAVPVDFDTDIIIDMVATNSLSGTTSNVHADAIINVIPPQIEIRSNGLSDAEFYMDINVNRGIRNITKSLAGSSNKLRKEFDSKFENSPRLKKVMTSPIFDSDKLGQRIITISSGLKRQNKKIVITLVDGDYVSQDINTINNKLDNVNEHVNFSSLSGDNVSNKVYSDFLYPARSDCESSNKWMGADSLRREWETQFQDGIAYRYDKKSYFEDGIQPVGYRPTIIKPVEPITPVVVAPLNFLSLWDPSGILEFVRIELDALIVMNEISIYHIADDGTKSAIHPVSASLELDIDSQVWSFKGQLLGADSLTWLTYRANFEINVNGHQLLFVLREYSRASSFASDAYTFTAVTNTQWLFSPYANLYSGAVENETGIWQIVEDILTQENFTLSRALTPEWILAPDSFSYLNKTPIEMAIQAAQASGAILQPNKTGNSLDVQPRYKVSPWNWNTLTDEQCDHVINADYVITESSIDNTTTEINRVLISGETHGVITDVVKSGTAGDLRGSDVVSNLSQDHNVNMELARNIMGDSGDQEILGLSLPLLTPDSDFGLLLPGEIVRIVYTDKSITGLCLSNSIPIQSITDVSQSVKLELNNGYR
ncbi:hypothetical protein ACR30L_07960 [Psychromonas sp. PT13]|uniref:hypothetical protein n=1 Tax=Psychromonas sp. PT13 TaxID=3439547 RepID=UPI003EB6D59B